MKFDPYDYAIQEDPFPAYAWLRDNEPVHHNVEHGFWVLSKHDDNYHAFRDEVTFSNRMGVSIDPSAWGPGADKTMSILGMDAPDHMRLRGLVSKAFTPRRVREMHQDIQRLASKFIEPALERGEFDFITDFAGKFPMDVISEMMGVPESDRDEVRRQADLLVHREDGVRDVPREGAEAAMFLIGYYQDLIQAKTKAPGNDLTSALIEADLDGDKLRLGEIVAFLFLMVVAGNETTTKLLGNALFHAHNNPGEKAKLLQDPTLVKQWVEETLRYDNSTQMLARYVTQDVVIRDTLVPADSQILLMPGSGNRDEEVFEDADRYDLDRDTSSMLSFGMGRHFCLGANLARFEANLALGQLLAKVSDFEVDVAGAQRVHSINVRGFRSLPVRVKVA